MLIEGSI